MAGCRLPVEKKQEKIVFVKQKKKTREKKRRNTPAVSRETYPTGTSAGTRDLSLAAEGETIASKRRSASSPCVVPGFDPELFALLCFPFLSFSSSSSSSLSWLLYLLLWLETLVFCAWISQRPATKGVERAFRLTGTRSTALDRCFTPRRPWTTLLKDDAGSLARLLRLGLPLRR
ncbi:hypothetical protein DTO166G4_2151 [Paecilomyces variotii]|nr:hypothetical protein DTO166G4_2151 [Paecilomyces variotii]KAJ9236899.1 hypothetical protein DTO166G5_3875 [Paecilomyces variotii]